MDASRYVPGVGVEPTWPEGRGILSPSAHGRSAAPQRGHHLQTNIKLVVRRTQRLQQNATIAIRVPTVPRVEQPTGPARFLADFAAYCATGALP